jgi:hypothetical protein
MTTGIFSGITKKGLCVMPDTISYTMEFASPSTHAPKNRKKSHHPTGKGSRVRPVKFCAIDGEGFTDSDGVHRYKLLGVGQDQISNPDGLGWDEIMEFLYDRYKRDTAYVGFFLGYDFTQWFRNLPENRARILLTREGKASRARRIDAKHAIAPHPVEYDGWQFDILGSKRLRIRPKRCHCEIQSCHTHDRKCAENNCQLPNCGIKKAPWMYICDTGGYFQTSFLNVIEPKNWPEPIFTREEFALIEEGKARRSNAILDDEAATYNRLENDGLERVMYAYANGLEAIGIHLSPSKWFGPGQAAQEWLKGRAPRKEDIKNSVPSWFIESAQFSYFGGWFELFAHGFIPGNCHEYDVNSAYPAVIASLPCLLHGSYNRGTGKPPVLTDGQLCLVRARVQTRVSKNQKAHIGAMLHRDKRGRISRPLMTEGWYWLHELEAAQNAKCIGPVSDSRYYEWMTYTPGECPDGCNPHPLEDIRGLYLTRLEVGKNSPLGKAAKLAYNSCYGKFAQSIGEPIYGNPIYASLITAGCRTQILNAIASHPKGKSNVVMIATDAVFFLDEHPTLPISDKLGEWDHTVKSNMTLFKPGVYWDDKARKAIMDGSVPSFKARGINAASFAKELMGIDNEFIEWALDDAPPLISNEASERLDKILPGWPQIEYKPNFVMKSALQCLIQNDWGQCGYVTTGDDVMPVKQSANPHDKRCNAWHDKSIKGRDIYRSEPRAFGKGSDINNPASVPYEKKFGMEDPFSDESKEKYGISPDGYVGDVFRDILMGRIKEAIK